jgi:cation-transporting ATPase E
MRTADIAISMQSGSSAVRLVADVVLLNDDFAIVPHLFLQGKRIVSRMSLVMNHFLLRVVTSAGIIGLSIIAQIPLWAPWQSSLLALSGVALPAIYVIGTRVDLRQPMPLMQMMRYASVVAAMAAGVVVMTFMRVPAYACWVGVIVSLLVLWGYAGWLVWPDRRKAKH